VKEIQAESNFEDLLKGAIGEKAPTVKISREDLKELREMADAMPFSDDMVSLMRTLQQELKQRGITASDRRWKQAVKLIKAFALLRGGTEVTPEDLEVLADILWTRDPMDRSTIIRVISPHTNPFNLKAVEYMDFAKEAFDKWNQLPKDSKEATTIAVEVNMQLNDIINNINNDLLGREGAMLNKLKGARDQIKEYQKAVFRSLMGGSDD
jgi:MoxR-like ATPase